ncbi:MAG: hypothetical protein WBL45_07470 [Solirubrobacterales bacterium]
MLAVELEHSLEAYMFGGEPHRSLALEVDRNAPEPAEVSFKAALVASARNGVLRKTVPLFSDQRDLPGLVALDLYFVPVTSPQPDLIGRRLNLAVALMVG